MPWTRKRLFRVSPVERATATLAAVLVLMAAALVSCDNDTAPASFSLTSEQQRDFDLFDLAERFSRHVMKRDFEQAYELTSPRLRREMSYEQFVAFHEEALAQHGTPVEVKVDALAKGEQIESQTDGFSEEASLESRAARVGLKWATQVDPQAGHLFIAWYYCWINMVAQDGQIMIDHVEYAPSSLY